MNDSLISVMIEVGIALHGGGKPFERLRHAKNNAKPGTANRRTLETLLKQDVDYLILAVAKL